MTRNRISLAGFRHRALCAVVLLLLFASGCAGSSASSRFYTLSAAVSGETGRSGTLKIAVGPVDIPDYLRRPQIVTRSGRNELQIEEFERWAGALEDDFGRVVAENIAATLAGKGVTAFPWKPSLQPGVTADCRIAIGLTRFEGTPGGPVLLKALWSLSEKGRNEAVLVKESTVLKQTKGNSYHALVEAMSEAVEELSREIAGGIREAGIVR